MIKRCGWGGSDPVYLAYHDEEWGTPVHDEGRHFEFLLLETMQAGLSWSTILHKRQAFRAAFSGFDPSLVAAYGPADIERLMADTGIVRNRRKIEGAVKNARAFLGVQKEFGSFDAYIWGFTEGVPLDGRRQTLAEIPDRTELSDRVAADMKKRGFAFVGSVTIYSHLQAIGVVNDHLVDCFRHG